jgi:hypothetical protein
LERIIIFTEATLAIILMAKTSVRAVWVFGCLRF